MTANKDFLTYNQQMKHLRIDKNINCSGKDDKTILCRYGYFNLVNGYKNPFVNGRDNLGNHRYLPNTSIKHLNAVKMFDEELRMCLLNYIVRAEEEVRTFVSYKFDEVNKKGKIAWYEVNAYNSNADIQSIIGVISKAYNEINQSKAEYVNFYLENHKLIPTWILLKIMKFSTLIDFIECSKNDVKDSICNLYSMLDDRGYPDYKLLIGSLHCMRIIRNKCAHNERIYTFRAFGRIHEMYLQQLPKSYTKTNEQQIIDLLIYLKYYLNGEDYDKLICKVKNILIELQVQIAPQAFDYVRAHMGIKDLSHLDILIKTSKNIEYDKFK